jgi:chitinase
MYKLGRAFLIVVVALALVVPVAGAASQQADRGLWASNVWYNVGDTVTYNGVTYQALQAHTSLTGWEPPNVPALWKAGSVTGPTATRTNPPAGATATPTRPPAATATPSTGGGTCWQAWNASAVYTGGNQVSRSGQNYQAAYWTQGNDPATSNGPAGSGQPWIPMGACGGTASTPTRTPTRTNTPSGPTFTPTRPPTGGLPSRVSAIYADISFTSIQAAHQATGQKYYALAFVLGNAGTCAPAWDGTHLMAENYYSGEINTVRSAGGDVIAVFGGANGSDLASVCPSVSSLQAAYQAVLNQYQFTWIDLNIEGGLVFNTTVIDRLNKAVRALQAANPNLKVSYTLPVLQSGLPQEELNVLSNAKSNGVRIDYVNVMTMNYGPWGIDMGQAAIDAATNTHNQLVGMNIPALVGITPMIGQNNTQGEIFSLADADQVLTYARANSYVGWLSFWSLGRDNGGCPGQTAASASCSGLSQNPYDFTNKFKAFP